MMKKLSIIVPVYNQEELITRALDSIPKRDDIEVLVVNDGSTDNTYLECVEWSSQNQDLEVILCNLSENRGLGNAKNIGYTIASGEYVNQLDSDDYLITEEYERVIDELDGTDIVYSDIEINSGEIFHVNEATQSQYCSGCARFIRREFLGDTRCPTIRATEDYYLNEALQKKPHTDKFTGIVSYHYNFPRNGSLYDQYVKGELKVEVENNDI